MTVPSAHLDLRDPGPTDVLGGVDALRLWELLRRARTPTEAGVSRTRATFGWTRSATSSIASARRVEPNR